MAQSRSIQWYSKGDEQTVIVGDQEIHVRFVGRKGGRGRIAITAPAGARFLKHKAERRVRKGDAHAGQR